MEQLNGILLQLVSELTRSRERDSIRPRSMVNIKVKLEIEIATYHHLLEKGENFDLGDALDNSISTQSIQKTTTCSKVVSEVNDSKVMRH